MKLFTLTVLCSLTVSTTFSQEPNRVVSGKDVKQSEKPNGEIKKTQNDQESTPLEKSGNQQSYPVKISVGERKSTPLAKEPTNEDRIHEIELLDQRINAISAKVEHVQSDQSQREEAEKTGWFSQMEKNKQELIERKIVLQELLKD